MFGIPSHKSDFEPYMRQAFREQEMRVEHTINLVRGAGILFFAVTNIGFWAYQATHSSEVGFLLPEFNATLAISGLISLSFFVGYLWLVHRCSLPGRYHPWLKYLTITVDYVSLTSKAALLGAEKLMVSFMSFVGYETSSARIVMTVMTTDMVIIFVLTFILYNFLSALRHGKSIILYSTILATLSCSLVAVQADYGEFAKFYTILLAVLSGFLTLVVSMKFNSLFVQFQEASQKLKDHNITLEQKVADRTRELSHKNELLNGALVEVEASNKKIMDSIGYAKRIQNSLLPGKEDIERFLPRNFIIWMPRDIVGGDIYQADVFENGFIISVLDCTGHGVPGALVSMIASSATRRITVDEGCQDPAKILKKLNSIIKRTLHQDSNQALSDDGLDASVCFVNCRARTLTYAGARLPLTVICNGEVSNIKGDRQSIGYKKSDLDFDFTNHTIDIEEGMSFYLNTDGMTDQLGGDKRVGFGGRRYRNLLLEHSRLPIEKQKGKIIEAFDNYKGENETQDDITVVGFCVNWNLSEMSDPSPQKTPKKQRTDYERDRIEKR